jgi:hypothetical protein
MTPRIQTLPNPERWIRPFVVVEVGLVDHGHLAVMALSLANGEHDYPSDEEEEADGRKERPGPRTLAIAIIFSALSSSHHEKY